MLQLLFAVDAEWRLARLHTGALGGVAVFAVGLADVHLAYIQQSGRDRNLHLARVVGDFSVNAFLNVVGCRAMTSFARNAFARIERAVGPGASRMALQAHRIRGGSIGDFGLRGGLLAPIVS